MTPLPDKIVQQLLDFQKKQEVLLFDYKKKGSLEMMYLVQWSILEKLVKVVTSQYRREILKKSLSNWLEYIKNDGSRPAKSPNTTLSLTTLPKKEEFKAALFFYDINADDIWLVMDSEGHHRTYRNELAHTGKKFSSNEVFDSLFADLENAVKIAFSKFQS
jgi:hypothetical protein